VRKTPLDQLMLDLQAAQAKLPASSRRDLSIYVPADAGRDAPSIVDPRQDDGANPDYPPNVRLNKADNGSFVLSFENSGSQDVVGYRIFRSINGGEYEKYGDSVLYSKDKYAVTVAVDPNQFTSFYVVAVDVVGKQSEPSLTAEHGVYNPLPEFEIPGFPDGTEGSEGAEGNDGNGDPVNNENPGNGNNGNNSGNGNGGNGNNGNGNGGNGNSNNTGAELTAPSAPTGLHAEYVGFNLLLSWSDSPISEQITEYHVYYSADNDGQYALIGTTSAASYEHSGAQSGGAYVVTAVNDAGESGQSAKLVAQ